MKNDTIIVKEAGLRLDKFLADRLTEYSRSQIQKYIKDGSITVNSDEKSPNYRINTKDIIRLTIPENIIIPEYIEPQNIKLDIIYEDDDLIVIDKPSGMTVHPGTGNPTDTLANALAYHYKKLSNINGPIRPGIVHRLDKDTSGIIVVAKTNFAHNGLAEQFTKRVVKKVYFGITWGNWKKSNGVVDQPIKRKRNDATSFAVNINGKKAITEYKIIKSAQYFSYVNFFPKTGRTHQIRVHSAFMNYPLLGDEKYGGGIKYGKGFTPEISKKIKALFEIVNGHILHAQELFFIHPRSNKKVTFRVDLPPDIEKIINEIKILNV